MLYITCLLKETVEKQNIEYIAKEKQIVTYLECKKTFFGKVSYFFKYKKKKPEPQKIIPKTPEVGEFKFYVIEVDSVMPAIYGSKILLFSIKDGDKNNPFFTELKKKSKGRPKKSQKE